MAMSGTCYWGVLKPCCSTGSPSRTSSLLVLCVLLLLLLAARRTLGQKARSDSGDPWPAAQTKFAINNKDDATNYLIKYGYLMCGGPVIGPRHRRQVPLPLVEEEEEVVKGSSVDVGCTDNEIHSAIKKFQASKGLKPTGDLDQPTLNLMRQRRCGNKDTETAFSSMNARLPVGDGLALAVNTSSDMLATAASSSPLRRRRRRRSTVRERLRQWKEQQSPVKQNPVKQSPVKQKQWSTQRIPAHMHKILLHEAAENTHVHRKRRDIRDAKGKLLKTILNDEEDTDPWQHRLDQLQEIRERRLKSTPTRPTSVPERTNEELEEKAKQNRKRVYFMYEDGEHPYIHNTSEPHEVRRVKRSFDKTFPNSSYGWTYIFNNQRPVTWVLTQMSERVPELEQFSTLELAFRMWSEVIPLSFTCNAPPIPDVQVTFHKGQKVTCNKSFDGEGGEVAHSRLLIYVHLDDNENFKDRITPRKTGVYLLKVFVHEIGHVIGLSHNNNPNSVLYPIYNSQDLNSSLELPPFDRRVAQMYYGKCNVTFNTIFDHLRRLDCKPTDTNCFAFKYRFNSYFFKQDMHWLYENREGRPRHGDPVPIRRDWNGISLDMDAAVQTFRLVNVSVADYSSGLREELVVNAWHINTYFFKGAIVQLYDDDMHYVKEVKSISDMFPPKPGHTKTIPDSLDSVFNDFRNHHLYFFKDDWVWELDPHAPAGQEGCCENDYKFEEIFPLHPADSVEKYVDGEVVAPLTGNVDAVFHSFKHARMYFVRGHFVWENVLYSVWDRQGNWLHYGSAVANELHFLGRVNDMWNDLCMVQMDAC